MSRRAKVDFATAKEKKTILKGVVKCLEKIETEDGEINSILTIDCNGSKVLITDDEVVNFPYAKSLKSLVGEEIVFTIKEVFDNDVVYGSMKEAVEVKNKPVMDLLEKGEVLEGKVVYETPYGVYIDIKGVQGFLKNIDFSDDGTEVSKLYPKGKMIKVKFKRLSSKGNILFVPENKYHGTSAIKKNDLRVGQIYEGKIVGIRPDRMFVNIIPGVDALCRPQVNETFRVGDRVIVMISKIVPTEEKLLVKATFKSMSRRKNEEERKHK